MHVKQQIVPLILLITTTTTTFLLLIGTTEAKWCTRFVKEKNQQQIESPEITNIDEDNTNEVKKSNNNNIDSSIVQRIERFCCEGYFLNGTKCQSYCKNSCNNGICNDNGECHCNPGYIYDNVLKDCQPECNIKCDSGKCRKPNICDCQRNYRFNNITEKCEPICNNLNVMTQIFCNNAPCIMGECFRPGQKVIPNEENHFILQSSILPCSKDCGFGNCSAPNICKCYEKGYKLNIVTNVCEPVCEDPCPPNSKCVAANVCACDNGYKLHPYSKNHCASLNSKIFSHHKSLTQKSRSPRTYQDDIIRKMLISPECSVGYELNRSLGKCQPRCHNNCLHGNCTAPDVCVCFPGYSLDLQSQSCKINSCKSPCQNGYCTETGDCVCQQGFTKSLLKSSGCEVVVAHTSKVLLIFFGVAALIIGIIWLIIVVERRRGNL